MGCHEGTGRLGVEIKELDRDDLIYALNESLKLQSHYASLLNDYDGGKRLIFPDITHWITRLRIIASRKNNI